MFVAKFVSSDKNDKKLPEQRFPESIKEWQRHMKSESLSTVAEVRGWKKKNQGEATPRIALPLASFFWSRRLSVLWRIRASQVWCMHTQDFLIKCFQCTPKYASDKGMQGRVISMHLQMRHVHMASSRSRFC